MVGIPGRPRERDASSQSGMGTLRHGNVLLITEAGPSVL